MQTVPTAKLETSVAFLPRPALHRVKVEPLHDVAGYLDTRHAWHVLHEPPVRRGFRDDARELCEHPDPVTRWRTPTGAGEILAGRATDHAREVTRRAFEILDPLAKDDIRTAHNAEAGSLETATQKIGTGKKGENQT